MQNNAQLLKMLDEWIYSFLDKNAENMPMRFCKLIAYNYTDSRIRKKYWDRMGVHMGEGTYANLGLFAVLDEKHPVYIGNNVSMGPYVTFITASSANNGTEIRKIPYVEQRLIKSASIIVEDEVWLGANVTILPGITIGECSVLGAGSVVTQNIEPYSLYAGTPAKKIRDLRTGFREITIYSSLTAKKPSKKALEGIFNRQNPIKHRILSCKDMKLA